MKTSISILIILLIVVGGIVFLGGDTSENKMKPQDEGTMVKDVVETTTEESADAMMQKEEDSKIMSDEKTDDTMMKAGTYEAYTADKVAMQQEGEDVVLFFRASWCPTCIALDKDINANLSKIPSNLKILDVDYDNSSDLKKKYGVTYQHTFVQVDKDGKMIAKWAGSRTLSALVEEVK